MFKAKSSLKLILFLHLLLANSAFGGQTSIFYREIDRIKLQYRISLSKDTFFVYENITPELWVKNISRKSIPLEKIYPCGNPAQNPQAWLIHDGKGKNYRCYVSDDCALIGNPKLKPGDSIGGGMGLISYGIKDTESHYLYYVLPPGKYFAQYKQDTTVFVFHVIEPVGAEAEALRLFLDAYAPREEDSLLAKQENNRWSGWIKRLLIVTDKYPNTFYARKAISDASGFASYEQGYQIFLHLIKDRPELAEYFLGNLSSYYLTYKKDLKGYKEELKRVIKRNFHPRLTAKAKQALKKAKKDFAIYSKFLG